MASPLIEALLGKAGWMDRPAEVLQKMWHGVFRAMGPLGRPMKNVLHGTPLGHPLHPLLTDVPIGAWTVLVVLDLVHLATGATFGRAAEIAVWAGIISALGAWLAGYTDWADTEGVERRTGLTHGVLMSVTILLFLVSAIERLNGVSSPLPEIIGFVGYGLVAVAGYFGGELPYGFATQINRNAVADLPEDFVRVGRAAEVAEGKPVLGQSAEGLRVLLFRNGNVITAIYDRCSHAGGPLHEGRVKDGVVTCPWHASRFGVEDGVVKGGPATFPQQRFEVRVRDGAVEVKPFKQ
jgi:nitrite reductase/ring-hydroxylating ferredoxin subunit/uncharacterized membrane protein